MTSDLKLSQESSILVLQPQLLTANLKSMNLFVLVEDMHCSSAEGCMLPSSMQVDLFLQGSILGGIQKGLEPERNCSQDSGLGYLLPCGSDSHSGLLCSD
jgi:hypothetical protein